MYRLREVRQGQSTIHKAMDVHQVQVRGSGRAVYVSFQEKCQSLLEVRQRERAAHELVEVYQVQVRGSGRAVYAGVEDKCQSVLEVRECAYKERAANAMQRV